MSTFQNFGTEGLEESEDRLGGNFQTFETDIYEGKIKALFAGKSKGGAMSLTVVVELPGNKEYKETIYISSKPTAEQLAKGLPGNNFFLDKETKKKMPLPGFTLINDLCIITCDDELKDVKTEKKTVKLWDKDVKKELPSSVDMVVDAIGKPIALAIQKVLENKNELIGDEYVATAETRELNNISKVFHPVAKLTIAEARAGKQPNADGSPGEYWNAWLTKNKGGVYDKRKIKDGAGAPKSGASKAAGVPAAGGGAAPKKSLFGPK